MKLQRQISGMIFLLLAAALLLLSGVHVARIAKADESVAAVGDRWSAVVAPSAEGAAIWLRAGAFVPTRGEMLTTGGSEPDAGAPGGRSYWIVQFVGPIQEAWKDEIRKAGGAVLSYLPDFAFVVYMDDATRAAVARLPAVAWIGAYRPAYKLSPALAGSQGVRELVVQTFPVEPLEGVAARAQALGADVTAASLDLTGGLLRLRLDAGQLPLLARIPAVQWIEPFYERVLHNDIARSNAIMAAETAWTNLGLYGQGQIVAVSDTGLDTGSLATLHQDFLGSPAGCTGTSRIIATFALGRSGNWGDSCYSSAYGNEGGHGTHVSGSVLGNGCRSGSGGAPNYAGSYAGLAPQAGLVMQSVMDSSCNLGGLPADLNTLFSQARTAGARIHTNSWGSAVAGQYTVDSQQTDQFTWNNKDYTILFSAGNEGIDASPKDGYIDADSIGAPATAKNAITVGASENNRATGGYNPGGPCSTWGGCWPTDYPNEPIKSDRLSNNPAGMVAFSSRGPTDDGRIKPDVVAPGSNILSTKSQGAYVSGGWGAGPNGYYQYMGGTSMATPLTAGAMTLIRQFYTDRKGVTPSAALLKATVINSATDLYPGQYASPQEQQPRLPNGAQGWGRVNVANATDDTHVWQDVADANGLATGGSHSYTYEACGASVLKVTLVWTDYPGSTSAAKALVNDLDLIVTAPDGVTTYRGNVFSGGWSTAGGAADRVNNVESVYLQTPAAGVWTIAVSGYNVPNGVSGKQGYALVVDRPGYTACSDFNVDVTQTSQTICAPANASYTVNVGRLGAFASVVTLSVVGHPTGTTALLSPNSLTPPGVSTLVISNTAAAPTGVYTLTVTGVSGPLTHQDTAALAIYAAAPPAMTLTAPVNGSLGQATTPSFTWGAVAAATYEIQIATDPAFTQVVASASGLTTDSYTPAAALSSDTVYYWRVRGVNPCGTGSYSIVAAFRTIASSASSFCRSPNLAIPDNNSTGVSDNQTVGAAGVLTDLNVSVQATHTWVGDLVFTVSNVGSGTSVTIIDRPGVPAGTYGCSGDNINATLDDEAAAPVESQCATSTPAINGTFTPNNPLSAFDGQQLANSWRMTASDRASSDTGTLNQWCLIATYGGAVAADYSDLPASYGVAWHTGSGSLRIGSQWTADSSFAANGDNASDDGVSFIGSFQAGQPATVRVNVQGAAAAGRWLRLWFDWDGDGVFSASEQTYDGAAANGNNDLLVSVPASVTAAVVYRARLYDSAVAPAALEMLTDDRRPLTAAMSSSAVAMDAAGTSALQSDGGVPYGGASGGEVEDGLTPCVEPGSVSNLAIGLPGGHQVGLTWTAAAGAARYEVWTALNDPYFTPAADCAAPGVYECASATGTSIVLSSSGDPARNETYLVRGVSGCGAKGAASQPRAGAFYFAIEPGSP